MVMWIAPEYSKTRVRRAGNNIRKDNVSEEDLLVIENWRACHSYILNTFQANLRNRSRNKKITVAQRLKRWSTIVDKLRREPSMQLSTMHDIAGCRLIFENSDDLFSFRKGMHEAKFKHTLRTKDDDRYNYIETPKESGYRGVHDIYEYNVSSKQGVAWNGLLIEIQYRTQAQHAWATAVEIADLATSNRIKFSEADEDHGYFFQLASEIIARVHENNNSFLKQLSDKELVDEFHRIDRRLGIMIMLRNLKSTESKVRFRTNTLLIFRTADEGSKGDLVVETFDSVNRAILRYEELEKELEGLADIVLVRADTPENIRDAFRNYFSDANDFVKYISDGLVSLSTPAEHAPVFATAKMAATGT
jgi:putative GTP pyrophosphokinase